MRIAAITLSASAQQGRRTNTAARAVMLAGRTTLISRVDPGTIPVPNPIRINGELVRVIGPTQASVQSGRDDETWYAIDLDAREGEGECTCSGFQYRKECRHLRAVRQFAAAHPDVELPLPR